jgi:hypothetical protein
MASHALSRSREGQSKRAASSSRVSWSAFHWSSRPEFQFFGLLLCSRQVAFENSARIGSPCAVTHYRSVLAPENHDRRATCARVERWPAVAVPGTGGQPSRRGKRIPLMLSIRTSMRLAAASAWVGPTITPKAGVRGTRQRRRAVDMFLAIARNRRASGFQPYLRAAGGANCRKGADAGRTTSPD